SCGPARRHQSPPRNVHYAQKINKCLLRTKNSNGKMGFAATVAAAPEIVLQPARAVYSQMTG
ncbi:MAG: hypothetical protein ACREIE_07100, partial [Nitrospiraceae bacterium]